MAEFVALVAEAEEELLNRGTELNPFSPKWREGGGLGSGLG